MFHRHLTKPLKEALLKSKISKIISSVGKHQSLSEAVLLSPSRSDQFPRYFSTTATSISLTLVTSLNGI